MPVTDDRVLSERLRTRHGRLETRVGDVRLTFHWSPFLANVSSDLRELVRDSTTGAAARPLPDFFLASAGLWNLMHDSPAEGAMTRALRFRVAGEELATFLRQTNWSLKSHVWRQRLKRAVALRPLTIDNPGEQDDSTPPLALLEPARAGYDDWKERSPTMVWLTSPSLLESHLKAHRLANTQFRNAPLQQLSADIAQHFVQQLPVRPAPTDCSRLQTTATCVWRSPLA